VLRPLARTVERCGIAWVLWRARPDLVWGNTVLTTPWVVAARRRGIPAVLMSHEIDRGWVRTRTAGLAGSGTALVACAGDVAVVLAEVLGVDRSTVTVLHPAVDVDAIAATVAVDQRRPLVVACGTADRRKGIDSFARAATLAHDAGSTARWCWIGRVSSPPPGPVTWLGELDDPLPLIAAADVFTLPSRAEGFPVVVLEAMALGRPIVASDLTGTREQVGDAGVLVPPGDPVALEAAVAGLLGDSQRAASLGAAARRRCAAVWDMAGFAAGVQAIADGAVLDARVG
jgi:glycosyltransferase involved in cell wall biosynthesis